MPRVTVWVPDELHRQAAERVPGLSWSKVVQQGVVEALSCTHRDLECQTCGVAASGDLVASEALARFYADLLHELSPLVGELGTAEGAARIARRVAVAHGIAGAGRIPLPRPTRTQRNRSRGAA